MTLWQDPFAMIESIQQYVRETGHRIIDASSSADQSFGFMTEGVLPPTRWMITIADFKKKTAVETDRFGIAVPVQPDRVLRAQNLFKHFQDPMSRRQFALWLSSGEKLPRELDPKDV